MDNPSQSFTIVTEIRHNFEVTSELIWYKFDMILLPSHKQTGKSEKPFRTLVGNAAARASTLERVGLTTCHNRDKVMLNDSPWKGVVRFGKRGKLNPRYVGPFKVIEKVGEVAYKLELPEELSRVHNTFHVSNLKRCHADEP
ncbi:hypothetical protein Tco_0468714 [Tanacetum coccineum]